MASLLIVRGPGSGTRFRLEKLHAVIGRDPGCDLVVPANYASRRHARVSRCGLLYCLDDLRSRSGTFLNSSPIVGLTPLRDGDRVRFCDFEAAVELPGGDAPSGRKLRLAAACCRRVWGLLAGADSREAVGAAEGLADGVNPPRLPPAPRCHWSDDPNANARWCAASAASSAAREPPDAALAAATGFAASAMPVFDEGTDYAGEREFQFALLRDIFGHPLRRDPAWLAWEGGTVPRLAEAAYQERHLPSGELDRHRLGVLADALEEAGCNEEALLGHLRGPGPCVRGCHVLDLLLGKE